MWFRRVLMISMGIAMCLPSAPLTAANWGSAFNAGTKAYLDTKLRLAEEARRQQEHEARMRILEVLRASAERERQAIGPDDLQQPAPNPFAGVTLTERGRQRLTAYLQWAVENHIPRWKAEMAVRRILSEETVPVPSLLDAANLLRRVSEAEATLAEQRLRTLQPTPNVTGVARFTIVSCRQRYEFVAGELRNDGTQTAPAEVTAIMTCNGLVVAKGITTVANVPPGCTTLFLIRLRGNVKARPGGAARAKVAVRVLPLP